MEASIVTTSQDGIATACLWNMKWRELGSRSKAELSVVEIRRRCRDYAAKFIDIQRQEFKRLGVFGDGDKPYLTMSYDYQATIVREFGKFLLKGSVYKGKKPVHWCATCKTALAEEGEVRTPSCSSFVDAKFRMVSDIGGRFPNPKNLPVSVVIWTSPLPHLPPIQPLLSHCIRLCRGGTKK